MLVCVCVLLLLLYILFRGAFQVTQGHHIESSIHSVTVIQVVVSYNCSHSYRLTMMVGETGGAQHRHGRTCKLHTERTWKQPGTFLL